MRRYLVDILMVAIAALVFGGYGVFWYQHSPWRVSPYPAPNAVIIPQTYQVYIPLWWQNYNANPASLKKGLSSPWSCGELLTLRASWNYDWSLNPIQCPGADSVPMLWSSGDAEKILASPNPRIVNGQAILLFNEPDESGQANMTPAEAITLTRRLFLKYPNLKWISPAPSQLHPDWLLDYYYGYVSAYDELPPLAGLAVHCYAALAADCIAYIQSQVALAKAWNVPEVWVTEWGLPTTADRTLNQALGEMNVLLDYMESEPRITHYAMFTTHLYGDGQPNSPQWADATPLMTANGYLSPWGIIFAER